jgi:hypothetical protein
MYYQWEWLSDLAIIPAWECFLAGVLVGGLIVGGIWFMENRRDGK